MPLNFAGTGEKGLSSLPSFLEGSPRLNCSKSWLSRRMYSVSETFWHQKTVQLMSLLVYFGQLTVDDYTTGAWKDCALSLYKQHLASTLGKSVWTSMFCVVLWDSRYEECSIYFLGEKNHALRLRLQKMWNLDWFLCLLFQFYVTLLDLVTFARFISDWSY